MGSLMSIFSATTPPTYANDVPVGRGDTRKLYFCKWKKIFLMYG